MVTEIVIVCLMVLVLCVQIATGTTWGNRGGWSQAEWTRQGKWKFSKGWWTYRRKDQPITYWLSIALQIVLITGFLLFLVFAPNL